MFIQESNKENLIFLKISSIIYIQSKEKLKPNGQGCKGRRRFVIRQYRGEDKRLSHGSHYPWGAGSTPATATTWQGRLMVGRQTHYLVIWVQLPTTAPKGYSRPTYASRARGWIVLPFVNYHRHQW